MTVGKLRPASTDEVVLQEGWIPTPRIEHVAVPLNYEAVGRRDMVREMADQEFGIGLGGSQWLDWNDRDRGVIRRHLRVGEKQAVREIDLGKARLQGAKCGDNVD